MVPVLMVQGTIIPLAPVTGESLKLHSVIPRVGVSTRFINSLLFQRTVLISVQTHQTRVTVFRPERRILEDALSRDARALKSSPY